jgi:hypothetical protein
MAWTAQPYTVKLEGAELVGYRAITICGTRDPVLISLLDEFLATVRENVTVKAASFGVGPDKYKLTIRTYGANGVMAGWEPVKQTRSHELGFVVEVVAETQEMASAVLSISRVQMLHVDFRGRLCKEGNMAFPYSPSDIETAPAYRFSVFHTVAIDDPCAPFPIEYETV